MEELLKNVFLAGIGSLAITYDKSKEIVNELIEKGKITVEQGKELNEELKKVVKEEKTSEKNKLIDDLNLATKDDIQGIIDRLDKLEDKYD